MVPGNSRSASTIAGARLLGLSRTAAAEFSFLVGLPILYGASLYKLAKHHEALSGDALMPFLVGTLVAFLSALVVVRPFVAFLRAHTFAPFAWYRLAAGALLAVGIKALLGLFDLRIPGSGVALTAGTVVWCLLARERAAVLLLEAVDRGDELQHLGVDLGQCWRRAIRLLDVVQRVLRRLRAGGLGGRLAALRLAVGGLRLLRRDGHGPAHRPPTNNPLMEASNGGRSRPRSVTKPLTSLPGVTSNAGLRAVTPAGAI